MATTFRPCSEDGCNRNSHHTAGGKRKMCGHHYRRWKKACSPIRCSVDGCEKAHVARGYCTTHLQRYYKNGDLSLRRKASGEAERFFWDVVVGHDGPDCLFWPFPMPAAGYPYTTISGERVRVHRKACEVAHGKPPSAISMALHSCGNGHLGCVSPSHLRWGSPSDNSRDSAKHGTASVGPRHGMARLSASDVHEIRRLRGTMSLAVIADRFGVSKSMVSAIHLKKRWAHV